MESATKPFLIIDGSAMIHRAYHAMPPLNSKDGTPTGAVHGFFSMLLKLIEELDPTHIIVTFDRPKPNFRQQLFPMYQAQRPSMDSDLSPQFGIIAKILEEAHIPVYAVDGFEADDLIGTLSVAANKTGDRVYVVTGDRDMLQLVNKHTRILMPIKGISEMKLFDASRVKEQYGVTPETFVELKALQGDASDNYPGVPGIGPKTASGLIDEYKTVDNIYKNIGEIRKKNPNLAAKLEAGHESAVLCHQLATILTNVPFEYDLEASNVKHISYEKWRKAFEKYEFKTLPIRLDQAFGKAVSPMSKKQKEAGQMKLL